MYVFLFVYVCVKCMHACVYVCVCVYHNTIVTQLAGITHPLHKKKLELAVKVSEVIITQVM